MTDSENSLTLWGLPEMPLGEITLRHVSFAAKRGAKLYRAPRLTLDDVTVTPDEGPAYDVWPASVSR